MIRIGNLHKRYKKVIALNGLNLDIPAGSFFGLLGPNGAGKTTIVNILTTLTRPDSGRVTVNGFDVVKEPIRAKLEIGVVPQSINLDMELSARENLFIHGLLYGMSQKDIRQEGERMLSFVGLEECADRPVKDFSGGMKRRLMIARALMHSPRVVFLDEPTVGLDVTTRRKLWELLKKINQEGATILLTTHYIEEAEALCDMVGIIDFGKLIALGSPKTLIQRVGPIVVEQMAEDGIRTHFFSNRKEATSFIERLKGSALIREANLEDVFLELTGRRVNQ
nr:ABC transporter ATP-binding protein [Desulfobacterales bacterium]